MRLQGDHLRETLAIREVLAALILVASLLVLMMPGAAQGQETPVTTAPIPCVGCPALSTARTRLKSLQETLPGASTPHRHFPAIMSESNWRIGH